MLFVGGTAYDLPLPTSVARKWDALSERLDLRVIGRAGELRSPDSRFRLLRAPAGAGAFQLALLPALALEGRRLEPDVVIAQSPYEALAALAVRWPRSSPRVVVEVHGDWRAASRLYGSRARRLAAGLADRAALSALRHADATRAISRFTAQIAERATGREPLASFPTYFDVSEFVGAPVRPLPAEPAVAWVGALQRVKAPYVFAQAWRRTAERVPDARLTMVGDGPLRSVAEALARDLPGRVRLERRLTPGEVAGVLDASTLLVLPSWVEGMGRVVIEAFSRGRPVVGSAAGGIPDLVDSGRNGLLVAPGDPEQLADALVSVLTDRPLAQRLATAAAHDAPSFQWSAERYADAVLELVQKAMRAT